MQFILVSSVPYSKMKVSRSFTLLLLCRISIGLSARSQGLRSWRALTSDENSPDLCEDVRCEEGYVCQAEYRTTIPCKSYPCIQEIHSNCVKDPEYFSTPARQLLVGYWGQNAAGPTVGRANYEKGIKHFCENYKFDIIVVAFVVKFFDSRNKDELPGLNFAHHCSYSSNPEYPTLYSCPVISWDIRDCQLIGKKVLLSLGGDTADGTLGSAARARRLAHNIWHLFLGGKGMTSIRPFYSTTVLDGIDLDIEIGSYKYYPDFVRELRRLMRTDTSRRYLITAAPQCPYPDAWMGPQTPGSALKEVGGEFDYLFIQFYNNYCYPGDKWFIPVLDQWLAWSRGIPNGPLILLGLPAGVGASGKPHYYFPPDKLKQIYQQIRDKRGFGGIMIWDLSWDQNNIINGRHYSEYLFDLVSGGTIPTPPPVPTTKSPTNPPTKAPTNPPTNPPTHPPPTTQSPAPATTQPTTGAVDCRQLTDGLHRHPTDCAKFIVCQGGVKYEKSCPPGLNFNPKGFCDWPSNVNC